MRLLCTFRKSLYDKNGLDPSINECWRAQTCERHPIGASSNLSNLHGKASIGTLFVSSRPSKSPNDDIDSKGNENIGFILSSPRNCVRYGPMMTCGALRQGPSMGRLGNQHIYRRPTFSNKRSDRWCAFKCIESSAARNPVADGVSEPAVLVPVRKDSILWAVGAPCVRPGIAPGPCFPELRRTEMSYFNQHRDSSRSGRERGPGECVILRLVVSIRSAVMSGLRLCRIGANDGFVAAALIILANAWRWAQVGRDECTGEVQTAMARRGCFSTTGVGLGRKVRSHEGFRCWTPLTWLVVL
jgi:hypothetical protein